MFKKIADVTFIVGLIGGVTAWMLALNPATQEGFKAKQGESGPCSVTLVKAVQKGGSFLADAYECK